MSTRFVPLHVEVARAEVGDGGSVRAAHRGEEEAPAQLEPLPRLQGRGERAGEHGEHHHRLAAAAAALLNTGRLEDRGAAAVVVVPLSAAQRDVELLGVRSG